MIDNEAVKNVQDNVSLLQLMHALPYLLVISMLFFLCFWLKDAAPPCCGGSVLGCLPALLHLLTWLVFLVLSSVICSIGITIKYNADQVPMPAGVFKGDPSLKDLLEHIQEAFPEFWGLTIAPLEGPP